MNQHYILSAMNKTISATLHPCINLSYMDLMADGDDLIKKVMLEMLLEELPTEFEKILQAAHKQDFDLLRRTSHKMKTTLSFVGNQSLSEANTTIERIARYHTNLDTLSDLLTTIEHIYPTVVEALRQELEEMTQIID